MDESTTLSVLEIGGTLLLNGRRYSLTAPGDLVSPGLQSGQYHDRRLWYWPGIRGVGVKEDRQSGRCHTLERKYSATTVAVLLPYRMDL